MSDLGVAVTPSDIQHSAATAYFGGVIEWRTKDDETEDRSPSTVPMDGGDERMYDRRRFIWDDADDEDEEEEEEEEHLAPADSAIIVPVDELVFPSEGT
ncbi:hypothetical protein Tco_0776413 [Tanacetum coccineum]